MKYLEAEGRGSFERPYGLAWLLQLAAELHEFDDPDARQWSAALQPLEQAVTARIASWMPKMEHPVRTGEHNNTAFSIGLMLDYARITDNTEFGKLVESRARDYYLKDKACPLNYEPSGEDFLSPCLAEADVMRRLLPADEFARWFTAFLPRVDLEPTRVTDPDRRQTVSSRRPQPEPRLDAGRHRLTGCRAADRRRAPLTALADQLAQAGLDSIKSEHYEGGHWLGSFAVYLVSHRGHR